MIDLQVPKPSLAYVRQRSALHLFRLSNRVLRGAIGLRQAQLVPRISLTAVLWTSAMLDKTAAALLFGRSHNWRKADFDEDERKRSMKDDRVS